MHEAHFSRGFQGLVEIAKRIVDLWPPQSLPGHCVAGRDDITASLILANTHPSTSVYLCVQCLRAVRARVSESKGPSRNKGS